MRRHFFEVVDAGGEGLKPIVIEAAVQVRRPSARITAEQAAEAGAVASG
jgi:formate dehydrogenase subunit delta